MSSLNGKVAIVTGASRGIAAAIASRLAKDGATVILNYAGNSAAAGEQVRIVEASGGRAVSAQADVHSNAAAVARMFDSAEASYGGVDILVNSAGIMKLSPIGASDDALFDSQVAINRRGTFNTLREAAKRLRNVGRIVNLSTGTELCLLKAMNTSRKIKPSVWRRHQYERSCRS
jgi:3-oxoacyl-[acyl-carrier protein] reductase